MMQRIAPQDNASELTPHPHRLTLRGTPSGVDFPPLCPYCGGAAANRIEYAKVFRHTDADGPTRYVVSSVSVPFCAASVFETARFVCTMRNESFANALRILNIDREWLANSPQAVAERRRTNRLVWIFGIVLALFAVWDVLSGFLT